MKQYFWKGPGVYGHKDGDIGIGEVMPSDVCEDTIAALLRNGKISDQVARVVSVADSSAELAEARETAETWKHVAEENARLHAELLQMHNDLKDEIVLANLTIDDLTGKNDSANLTIADLTEKLTAAVGGKKGK